MLTLGKAEGQKEGVAEANVEAKVKVQLKLGLSACCVRAKHTPAQMPRFDDRCSFYSSYYFMEARHCSHVDEI